MIERLVENWLDNASERSYQRCFCQMLSGRGLRILHNTEHTPLEFGKDVIAVSPSGNLVAYQLKGNPGQILKPGDFSQIRGQLDQLATLAIAMPGTGKKVPDECYLVTNGEIDEAVYHQIQLLNESLTERGHAPEKIKSITRGTLLQWANELGLSLWPSEIEDFANLVRILNHEGNESLPAKLLDSLLRHTLSFQGKLKAPELRRRITSAAIITAVALHSFSRRRNHYAEITAWTMFITYTIAACEKNGLSFAKNGAEAVRIARDAVYDLLGLMCEEVHESAALSEGDVSSEFAFYRPRALLVYALMAVYWIWSEEEGWKRPEHKPKIEEIVPSNLPDQWLWGEGALPHFLTYLWCRKRYDATLRPDMMTAAVLRELMSNKLGKGSHLASPYYGIEDVVRHQYSQPLGCDDPFEGDSFEATSYFAESLMVFLVRANLKQTCKSLWPDFTKLSHERLVPDRPWQFCLYRTGETATNETQIYPNTYGWDELQDVAREHAAEDVPATLKSDRVLLLLFVNIFPFRAGFSAMKFLHKEFDGIWFL